MKNTPDIRQFDTAHEASEVATRFIVKNITSGLTQKKYFTIVLPGGSAPVKLNTALRGAFAQMDVSRIHWFFGDERAVGPDHHWSNYRMQKETLFQPLRIQKETISRIRGERGAQRAAQEYQKELTTFFHGPPIFDLVILGVGPDGHTASIFPGTAALSAHNVPVVGTGKAPLHPIVERITMTLPVINAAKNVIFFTGTTGKEDVINQICHTAGKASRKKIYPCESVKTDIDPATWFIYRDQT